MILEWKWNVKYVLFDAYCSLEIYMYGLLLENWFAWKDTVFRDSFLLFQAQYNYVR